MKLALNYSHPAVELVQSGTIQIDLFKTPDWPELISAARLHRPVAVHFNLQAGQGQIANHSWDAIAAHLADTGTRYVNLHLTPTCEHFPNIPQESVAPEHEHHIVQAQVAEIEIVARRFGPQAVIVENIPYRGADCRWLRLAVEPGVICQVVRDTGCGLLLDISHARIAAHHLGMDACDYMSALPVDRLRELHFTGLQRINGRLQDHLEAQPEDWQALEWVLEQIRRGNWAQPHLLAFEYGGVGGFFSQYTEVRVIAGQVPKLYDLVHSI
jgi:uncharacterized protein (UPF0276 family)